MADWWQIESDGIPLQKRGPVCRVANRKKISYFSFVFLKTERNTHFLYQSATHWTETQIRSEKTLLTIRHPSATHPLVWNPAQNKVRVRIVFALRTFSNFETLKKHPPRFAESSLRGVFCPRGLRYIPRRKPPLSGAFKRLS